MKALRELQKSQEMLEKKLSAEITPAAPDAAAGEIRAHFKSQKHPFTQLAALVKAGDRRTIAAVLKAPSYLSGLQDAQRDTLRGIARETWFPEEVKTLADIEKAAGRVQLLLGTVKSTLEPLIKEWSGTAEDKAFAALGGGAS